MILQSRQVSTEWFFQSCLESLRWLQLAGLERPHSHICNLSRECENGWIYLSLGDLLSSGGQLELLHKVMTMFQEGENRNYKTACL